MTRRSPGTVAPDDTRRRRFATGRMARGVLLVAGISIVAAVLWGAVASSLEARRRERDDAFLRACQAASAASDWPRLERVAAEWSAASPGAAAAWISLAEAAVSTGRPADAAAYLARVPDDDPRAVAALLARVDLLFVEVGRPLEAVATCERILAIDPKQAEAHRRLAFFHAVTLQRERLAEEARRAIALGCDAPETYVYLVGSKWLTLSNTQAMNEGWLWHDPDNELFLVAAACGVPDIVAEDAPAETGEAAEAADAEPDPAPDSQPDSASVTGRADRLAQLLRRFPSNRELLVVFIQQAATRGDVDDVVRLLAAAPPEAIDDGRFWRFKGWVHAVRGEVAEAEAAFRKALDIDPFDHASQHELAGVLRKTGRTDEAARMAGLADVGRDLRREILQQKDVRSIPLSIMAKLAAYAADCGQAEVSDRLNRAIERRRSAP